MDNVINYVKIAQVFAAGLAMAIGVLGPTFAQGKIGSAAVENIGKYPEMHGNIMGAMTLSCILAETSSVFVLLIAILIVVLP